MFHKCLIGGVYDISRCAFEDNKEENKLWSKQIEEMVKYLALPLTILLVVLILSCVFCGCFCMCFRLMTTEKGGFGRYMTMKLGSRGSRGDEITDMRNV